MKKNKNTLQKKHSLEYPILVKKGNALIHAIGHPNIMATRMLLFALTKIKLRNHDDDSDKELVDNIRQRTGVDFGDGLVAIFSEKEFKKYLPGHNGSFKQTMTILSNVPSPCDLIHNWVVNIPSSDGRYLAGAVSVITATYYDVDTGHVFIKFNDEEVVKKELYSITEKYSLLDLRQEMRFHSVYSARLYELLISEIGMDNARNHVKSSSLYTFHFGLKRLEYLLGTCYIKEGTSNNIAMRIQAMFIGSKTDSDFDKIFEQYKEYMRSYRFNDLWRNVIDIAMREINDNMSIPYTIEAYPEKTGRSVTSIVFAVKAESKSYLIEPIDEPTNDEQDKQDEYDEILKWFDCHDIYELTDSQRRTLIKVADGDLSRIEKAYRIAGASSNTQDAAKFLTAAIRDRYDENTYTKQPNQKTKSFNFSEPSRSGPGILDQGFLERLKAAGYNYFNLSKEDIIYLAEQKYSLCILFGISNASMQELVDRLKAFDIDFK